MVTPRTTLLAIVVAGLLLAAGSSGAATSAAPRVTIVADSVGGVLFWQRDARDELARGIDLRIDIRTCRRLVMEGCVYDGERPPSALEAIRALGPAVGPLVVVDVGYNDSPAGYGAALDRVMRALLDTGVERVVWVTLRERRPSWAEINDAIRAGARRWPQISVGEWDRESVGHDEWFADGIHMNWTAARLRPLPAGARPRRLHRRVRPGRRGARRQDGQLAEGARGRQVCRPARGDRRHAALPVVGRRAPPAAPPPPGRGDLGATAHERHVRARCRRRRCDRRAELGSRRAPRRPRGRVTRLSRAEPGGRPPPRCCRPDRARTRRSSPRGRRAAGPELRCRRRPPRLPPRRRHRRSPGPARRGRRAWRCSGRPLADPQVRHAVLPEPETLGVGELHHDLDPERCERLQVERARPLVVGDVEGDVVEPRDTVQRTLGRRCSPAPRPAETRDGRR